jgi:predicted RNase H-like HicB family nuclease
MKFCDPPRAFSSIEYNGRRNSTMSRAAAPAPPVAVDVPVILTAIVRPEPEAGGYSASIPALPGCHTQGETLDEVRANLREAAEGWLAVAHDDALARDAAASAP